MEDVLTPERQARLQAGADQRLPSVTASSNPEDSAGPASSSTSRSAPHISTACETCRQRKRKCDGRSPCASCSRSAWRCVYNVKRDRRRQRSEQNNELGMYRRLFGALGEALQDGNEASLLSSMRQGIPLEELVDSMMPSASRDPHQVGTAQQHVFEDTEPGSESSQTGRFQSSPGYVKSFGNLPFSSAITTNGYSNDIQSHQQSVLSCPEWQILPLVEPAMTPVDHVCTDFYRTGRQFITDGVPVSQVASTGPVQVDLLLRARLPSDPYNAFTWASELHRTFSEGRFSMIVLASTYMSAKLMCWLLNPTPDTYLQIPWILRPTDRQRLVPHRPVIDVIPILSLRNLLIANMRDYIDALVRAGMNLNWQHSAEDALFIDRATGSTCVSPEFAAHLSNSKNWILGRNILHEFPQLEFSEIQISESHEVVCDPYDNWEPSGSYQER